MYTAIEWFSLCFFLLLIRFLQKNSSRKFLLPRLVLHALAKIFEGFTFLLEFYVFLKKVLACFDNVSIAFHEKMSWQESNQERWPICPI
ncbi:hypothetical protein EUGRSUZ_C00099 [Eucalyptus grandis]|uniref:Uncharacterized protein n=2 Tax=Eucalyptus grandis TaxID=71139 RepID=A0ACC3L9H0_EUCGR|nr:hypothetical protein EUGRSUZ_C00099 [Eucalyptus grandis]